MILAMKKNNAEHIKLFLNLVSQHTENGEPVLRAKVLKWTSEQVESNHGLSKQDKEEIWNYTLDQELVERDERGNILRLSDKGILKLQSMNVGEEGL